MTSRTITGTKHALICVGCDGCGWCEGSPAFTCPDCKGVGTVDVVLQSGQKPDFARELLLLFVASNGAPPKYLVQKARAFLEATGGPRGGEATDVRPKDAGADGTDRGDKDSPLGNERKVSAGRKPVCDEREVGSSGASQEAAMGANARYDQPVSNPAPPTNYENQVRKNDERTPGLCTCGFGPITGCWKCDDDSRTVAGTQRPEPTACGHKGAAVEFDPVAAKGLSDREIRRRWPRFDGACPDCGARLIKYASQEHYVMGDW